MKSDSHSSLGAIKIVYKYLCALAVMRHWPHFPGTGSCQLAGETWNTQGQESQRTRDFISALPPLNESLRQVTQPLTVSAVSFLKWKQYSAGRSDSKMK